MGSWHFDITGIVTIVVSLISLFINLQEPGISFKNYLIETLIGNDLHNVSHNNIELHARLAYILYQASWYFDLFEGC